MTTAEKARLGNLLLLLEVFEQTVKEAIEYLGAALAVERLDSHWPEIIRYLEEAEATLTEVRLFIGQDDVLIVDASSSKEVKK